LAKKRRSSSRHLSASRPPRCARGGPSRGSAARSITEPKAPARSSSAPQITSWSRASRHVAAHIGQGSRVT